MAELLADEPCGAPAALSSQRATLVSPLDVSRFVRDPHAFAASVGAVSTEAFVNGYLKGLAKRLDGAMGAPRAAQRLATLAPSDFLSGGGDRVGDGELVGVPSMGAIVIALASAAAVVAAVSAYSAYTLFMTKPAA